MDESLKALRLLFGLLVAATGAVAGFVIGTPDSSAPYRAARLEITRLVRLRESTDEYRDETIQKLNDHQFPELVQAMIPTKPLPARTIPQNPTAFAPASPAPEPDPLPGSKVPDLEPDGALMATGSSNFVKLPKTATAIWGKALELRFEMIPVDGTLQELYRHFNEREKHNGKNILLATYYFNPDAETFAVAFRKAISANKDMEVISWHIENVSAGPLLSQETTITPSQIYTGQLFVEFSHKSSGEIKQFYAGPVQGMWSCGSCGPEKIMPLFSWLERNGAFEGLYSPGMDTKTWFPELRAIWSEIDDMGIDEAETHVEAAIDSKTQTVSLFGVSVGLSKLLFVYPIGAFALAWMLMLHIARVRQWCERSKGNLRELVGDHWFVFFDGYSPLIVYSLCVVVVPVGLFAMLIAMSHTELSQDAHQLGGLACIIYLYVAAKPIESLYKIRRMIVQSDGQKLLS